MNELKSLTDYIQVLIRYIAAGGVFVLAIIFLDPDSYLSLKGILLKSPWVIFSSVGIIGLVIYSLHQALFDKLFYSMCIGYYLREKAMPEKLLSQIENYLRGCQKKDTNEAATAETPDQAKALQTRAMEITNIRFGLFSQTYLRRGSDDVHVKAFQNEMDKKLALLNFLYCAAYSLVGISVGFFIKYRCVDRHHFFPSSEMIGYQFHFWRVGAILVLGLITFIAGFCLDIRITKREMWVVQNYPQTIPGT